MRFTLLGFSAFNDPSLPAKKGPTMRFTPAKTAAAAAALVVSAGLFAAAPAQSQTASFENLMKVAAQADTISCPDLKKQLDKTGRVNANTTRTDLVNMANAELASKPALRAAAGGTINKVADRAVACGLVKTGNGGNNAPAPSNRTPGVPAPARPAAPGPALPANPVDQIVNQVNQAIGNPAQMSSAAQAQFMNQINAYRAQVNANLPAGSSI